MQFTVINKNIYMEYEEYEIKIENQTGGKFYGNSFKFSYRWGYR